MFGLIQIIQIHGLSLKIKRKHVYGSVCLVYGSDADLIGLLGRSVHLVGLFDKC